MLQFLNEITEEGTAHRKQLWAGYRELIQRSLPDGVLPTADRKKLASLVEELQLTTVQIERHANALMAIRQRDEAAARLIELEAAIKARQPELSAALEQRQRAIDEQDRNVAPIAAALGELERQAQAIRMRTVPRPEIDPELREFLDIQPPPPPPSLSQEELKENQLRHNAYGQLEMLLADVRDGRTLPAKKNLNDHALNAVERAKQFAKAKPNPKLFRSAEEWAQLLSRLPEHIRIPPDPRKTQALKTAKQMREAKHEPFHDYVWSDEAKNLVDVAQRLNWIDENLRPIPASDETTADAEATTA